MTSLVPSSRSTLALVALAACIAGCATTRGPSVRTSDQTYDSSAAWAAIDANGDGTLSRDELEQQRAMGLLQDFSEADGNGDGSVSQAEWDAWWPRMTDHFVRTDVSEPTFDSVR